MNTATGTVGNLLAYVPSQGYVYSYDDAGVETGQTYWYWLEDIDFNDATTLHGPVSVTMLTPTAVGLGGLEAVQSGNRSIVGLALAAGLAAVAGGWTLRRRRLSL